MASSNNPVRTRRAVLTGAAVGVAAVAAGAPRAANASAGDPVILGALNGSDQQTSILGTGPIDRTQLRLINTDMVLQASTARSNAKALWGDLIDDARDSIAVKAETNGHHSNIAVSADAISEGIAVKAKTLNGTGVWTEATGGHALHVIGRALFSRSGRAVLNAGQASKTIANQFVGDGGFVLATIQGDVAGTYVRGVSLDVQHNRFTIRLNKRAPKRLVVGWFIVN